MPGRSERGRALVFAHPLGGGQSRAAHARAAPRDPPPVNSESLLWLCVLLFADGATLAVATTPLLLAWAPQHAPWKVAVFGGLASALGNCVQLLVFRWMLRADRPWMRRFLPPRTQLEKALARYPSASFAAIAIARATPLPDAPIKLVVAFLGYPLWRYFLAVLMGALPYYYLLAELGSRFHVPMPVIVVLLVTVVVIGVVEFARNRGRRAE